MHLRRQYQHLCIYCIQITLNAINHAATEQWQILLQIARLEFIQLTALAKVRHNFVSLSISIS